MKLGISYWMFDGGLEGKLPVFDAIDMAKAHGFDSIELCIAKEGALTDAITENECKQIKDYAVNRGIEISSLASGQSWATSPTSDNAIVRNDMVVFTRKALEVTRWLGADAYLLVPGAVDVFFIPDGEVVDYDVCYDRARDFIEKVLDAAKSNCVSVCIENVWNKFLLSPLEMRDFIDSFNCEYVGSYFDVGNVLLTGYPEQWIRILGKRIKRVHLKDFKKSAGTAEGFVDMLAGDVDFEAVKAELKKINYDGYATAEVLPYQTGRIERTIDAMNRIFR